MRGVRALLVLAGVDRTYQRNRSNWFDAQCNGGPTDQVVVELLGEAWHWLISTCLITFDDPLTGSSEGIFIRQRGREALVLGLDRLHSVERLDVDPQAVLALTTRWQFLLGEYEPAASQGCARKRVRSGAVPALPRVTSA